MKRFTLSICALFWGVPAVGWGSVVVNEPAPEPTREQKLQSYKILLNFSKQDLADYQTDAMNDTKRRRNELLTIFKSQLDYMMDAHTKSLGDGGKADETLVKITSDLKGDFDKKIKNFKEKEEALTLLGKELKEADQALNALMLNSNLPIEALPEIKKEAFKFEESSKYFYLKNHVFDAKKAQEVQKKITYFTQILQSFKENPLMAKYYDPSNGGRIDPLKYEYKAFIPMWASHKLTEWEGVANGLLTHPQLDPELKTFFGKSIIQSAKLKVKIELFVPPKQSEINLMEKLKLETPKTPIAPVNQPKPHKTVDDVELKF